MIGQYFLSIFEYLRNAYLSPFYISYINLYTMVNVDISGGYRKKPHRFKLLMSFCEKPEVQAEDEDSLHSKQQNNWFGKQSLMCELAAAQVSQEDVHFLCSESSQSLPELLVYCDSQKLHDLTSYQVWRSFEGNNFHPKGQK